MISDERLPDDLAEIERSLGLAACEPNPALCAKAMGSVEAELRRSRQTDFWRYAASVAAIVVVLINLGVSAAFVAPDAPSVDPHRAAALCEELTQLEVGLSRRELSRQSVLLAAGERLVLFARPRGSAAEASTVLDRR